MPKGVCYNTGRTHFKKGHIPWTKGRKLTYMHGVKHPNWKGGRTIMNTGYARLQIKGKTILEHRHIMEESLGRKLKRKEVVHHKNGNRLDNRIENLELVKNNSRHLNLHRWSFGGKTNKKCLWCEEIFESFKSDKRIFCSKKCYTKSQRRTNEKSN